MRVKIKTEAVLRLSWQQIIIKLIDYVLIEVINKITSCLRDCFLVYYQNSQSRNG